MSPNELGSAQWVRAVECIQEVAESLLTSKHVPEKESPLGKVFKPRATQAHRRFREANLIGFGYGAKESGNGELTGDLAVRVYVTHKVERSQLPRKFFVKPTINGVLTDVVVSQRPRWHAGTLVPGAAISRSGGGPGSIGCLVKIAGQLDRFFLTAAHVLAPDDGAKAGDHVFERISPGAGTKIGKIKDFEPLKTDGTPIRIDAALAQLDDPNAVKALIPKIGALNPEPLMPVIFQSVRKFGATTKHTLGVITAIGVSREFEAPGGRALPYEDLFEVTGCGVFSRGGDSGALVVDALTNRPIGLVVGGVPASGSAQQELSYVVPLKRVIERFSAELIS